MKYALIVMVVVIFALFAFILWAFTHAHAHDHSRPELNGWYLSLSSHGGSPCCDNTDAKHISDVDWDSNCADGKCQYRVRLYDKWWNVPDDAVVDGPNRDGAPLVWMVPTWQNDKIFSVSIRCFLPGAGG